MIFPSWFLLAEWYRDCVPKEGPSQQSKVGGGEDILEAQRDQLDSESYATGPLADPTNASMSRAMKYRC